MIIFMVRVCIILPIFLRGVLSFMKNLINLKNNRVLVDKVNLNEIWSCPLEGFYKFNIDGATDNATSLRSIGAVFQNDSGVFMGALAMQSLRGVSILATKLQAIYRGGFCCCRCWFFPFPHRN
ncbi:unnamed protein product [Prunus brigantina]